MSKCCRISFWMIIFALVTPLSFAATPVKSIVIFGDSLSDIGNTTHLLKSLRQDESPSYLVRPLKIFVINKMTEYANDYYVPQIILDAGIEAVTQFFDKELAPTLADLIGKVKRVPVLPGKPYWNSRFSNGRVWNEYLLPMLALDKEEEGQYTNRAFGGSWAMTYNSQLTIWNFIQHPLITLKTLIAGKLIPPSLGLIVQGYLLENGQSDNESIYFIFTGSNDYLNSLIFEDNYNETVMNAYIDNVINDFSSSTKKLIETGAKRFVIMGIPYIGNSPKFIHTNDKDLLNSAVERHNQRLQQMIENLKNQFTQVDFLFIDIQGLFAKALNDPQKYGLTNTTDACIDVKLPMFHLLQQSPFAGNFVLQYAQVLQYHDNNFAKDEKNYQICDTPDTYLFWDEVHPSTKIHKLLATQVCEVMEAHGYEVNCNTVS